MNSMKRDRFIRVHEKRLNNALKSIKLVGNCLDHTNYVYSLSEAQNIIETLRQAVSAIEERIHPHKDCVSINYSRLVAKRDDDDEFMVEDQPVPEFKAVTKILNSLL